MSMELHVLVEDSRLPDIGQWQNAVDALGFNLKLDPTLVVREHTGFVPCAFKGQSSGFEFDVSPASTVAQAYAEFKDQFSGRDTSANFRWGGDLNEMACSLIASVALAQVCGGLWFDPESGSCLNHSEALAQARLDLAAARI